MIYGVNETVTLLGLESKVRLCFETDYNAPWFTFPTWLASNVREGDEIFLADFDGEFAYHCIVRGPFRLGINGANFYADYEVIPHTRYEPIFGPLQRGQYRWEHVHDWCARTPEPEHLKHLRDTFPTVVAPHDLRSNESGTDG